MRIKILAVSAVALAGCSWSDYGGGYGDSFAGGGMYGGGCMPSGGGYAVASGGCGGAGMGYGGGGMGYGGGAGMGYGGGAGYGAAGGGYGMGYGGGAGAGYAGAGMGADGMGYGAAGGVEGLYGSSGVGQYGTVGGGAGAYTSGVTTISGAAPYGQAVAGGVTTVQGAPLYVSQPYPAYYAAGYGGGGFASAAMPFGFGLFVESVLNTNGDVYVGKEATANNPKYHEATAEFVGNKVAYDEAFDMGVGYGAVASYDMNRNTTLFGKANFRTAEGQTVDFGTIQPGTYDSVGNFTASAPIETVSGEFTDLEEYTVGLGVRQYMGNDMGFRPYVSGMLGATHNNDVTLSQYSETTLDSFDVPFIEKGWTATAEGMVGAEMAVGPMGAIGVETGVRWQDATKSLWASEKRVSIPLSLRGRVAF